MCPDRELNLGGHLSPVNVQKHIERSFLRGFAEQKCHEAPDWDRVKGMARRFYEGDEDFDKEWERWWRAAVEEPAQAA